MVSELKPVIRAFGLEPAPTAADPKRFAGRVGAIDVVASMTGIGMVPAADATERVLAAEHPDLVMVVGHRRWGRRRSRSATCWCPSVVVNGPSGQRIPPGGACRHRHAAGGSSSSDDFQVEDDALVELEAAGVVALDMETACGRDRLRTATASRGRWCVRSATWRTIIRSGKPR